MRGAQRGADDTDARIAVALVHEDLKPEGAQPLDEVRSSMPA